MSRSGNDPGECLGRQGSHPKDPDSSNIKALSSPKVGFLNLAILTLFLGGRPIHCRMFSRKPGL